MFGRRAGWGCAMAVSKGTTAQTSSFMAGVYQHRPREPIPLEARLADLGDRVRQVLLGVVAGMDPFDNGGDGTVQRGLGGPVETECGHAAWRGLWWRALLAEGTLSGL